MDCPLCAHPECRQLETEIITLKSSKRDVAEIIGCRVDEIYDHMTKHLTKQSLVTTDSKRNVLLDTLNKMQSSLEHIASTKQHGPIMTKQLVELAREIRQTIAGLDVLDGNKQSAQHITIQQYNDFRSLVVTKIISDPRFCPNCRKIIIEDIEQLEDEKNGEPVIEVEHRNKSV